MLRTYIPVGMRTTLTIDDTLLKKASLLSGIKEKTSLVKAGLEALIAQKSSIRLAELGGTERSLKAVRQRKS
jgi:Arc/MetJ family transcription regulator